MFRKEKLRLLLTFTGIFLLVFSLFSFSVYRYVSRNQYKEVDMELLGAKRLISRAADSFGNLVPPANPRIITFLRDEKGEPIANTPLPDFYKKYEKSIKPSKLNEIQDLTIETFNFRTLTFPVNVKDKTYMIQLIINTTAEAATLAKLLRILIIGGAAVLVVSIGVGGFMAKRSLDPALKAWDKQRRFVEDASHELRTPLTVIQSKLELMLLEPRATVMEKSENIGTALQETRRLSKLVSDLLTLARADSNTTELKITLVNINEVLHKVIEPYLELAKLEDKTIVLDSENNLNIKADEDRLHQLLVILIDNALKYTEGGGLIKVKAQLRDNRLNLSVEDNGVGIRPENYKRIFERFYREDDSRSKDTGGSGLGLSIAKWIVLKHGGSISAKANVPKGTIIEVKLPRGV